MTNISSIQDYDEIRRLYEAGETLTQEWIGDRADFLAQPSTFLAWVTNDLGIDIADAQISFDEREYGGLVTIKKEVQDGH